MPTGEEILRQDALQQAMSSRSLVVLCLGDLDDSQQLRSLQLKLNTWLQRTQLDKLSGYNSFLMTYNLDLGKIRFPS